MIFILLPAFNEEKTLPRLLEKIIAFGNNHGGKVTTLVCNDSSTDKTLEAIKPFENQMNLAIINHSINLKLSTFIIVVDHLTVPPVV